MNDLSNTSKESNSKDIVSQVDEVEIKEGAFFAALSYIFFLWVLVFVLKKDNHFSRFHAKQGIVIFMAEMVSLFFPLIPFFGNFLYKLSWFIFVFVSIYGVYSSLSGKWTKIPIVYEISKNFVI